MPLLQIAYARSGDKGNTANIGVIAYEEEGYPLLASELTAERVRAHLSELALGEVHRYELPNLGALNFVLHRALGGGGTVSLRSDAQGKLLATALLRMKLRVPRSVADRSRGRGRVPAGWNAAGGTP